MNLLSKTDLELKRIIENHRKAEKLDAPLAVAAIEEQIRRNTVFNIKAGIEFLLEAAREKRVVNYKELAEAGGVLKSGDVWYQNMTQKIPLSQIIDYAHTHKLPAISSLVETKQGITNSILGGFEKGLKETGIEIPIGMSVREFYLLERQRTFDWAEKN